MSMYVRLHNQIAERGIKALRKHLIESGTTVNEPDAILLRSFALKQDDIPSSVLAVARAGAGVNNIPLPYCSDNGIVVFNTPGANANSVKELVLAVLLIASRNLFEGIAFTQSLYQSHASNTAKELSQFVEKEKKRFKGFELRGKTLGIVGLGAIGSQLAQSALDLGMVVYGYDPHLSVEAAWRVPNEVEKKDKLENLLSTSDFVSIHVPAIPQTQHLLNAQNLPAIKHNAILVNYSRSDVVDNVAVKDQIEKGALGGYFSDFPDLQMQGLKHVYAMPHLGASTFEAEEYCAVMAAEQLSRFLLHGEIVNSVNFPTVKLHQAGKWRLCIINRNVPNMLSSIMSVVGKHNLNVAGTINRSRDDLAYNLVDFESCPEASILSELTNIEGIMRVRLIQSPNA